MSKMAAFEGFLDTLTDRFNWVSIAALAALLCVALIDIIGSKVFNRPIPGSIDVIGLLGGIITAFSVARTQNLRRHIQVDFVALLLPEKVQYIIGAISSILCLIFVIIVVFTCLEYGISLQKSNERSITLSIPFYPFVYAMIIAFIPLVLTFLKDVLGDIRKVIEK